MPIAWQASTLATNTVIDVSMIDVSIPYPEATVFFQTGFRTFARGGYLAF
jgi:hypothetical protein